MKRGVMFRSGMKESFNNFQLRRATLFAHALLALLLSAGGLSAARAQEADEPAPSQESRRDQEARRGAGGAGLLRALNLTPEQRAQIKAIRRETEPRGRELGLRLRQARHALDEAIYADQTDDRVIEERVRAVSAAQAAVVRLRAFTELKIRRVLSNEQLNAFRQLQRGPRRRQERMNQERMNRTSPRDDSRGDDAPASDRMRRRRREQLQMRPR
jgi:Spy/CpxP family protein refolding chaperone